MKPRGGGGGGKFRGGGGGGKFRGGGGGKFRGGGGGKFRSSGPGGESRGGPGGGESRGPGGGGGGKFRSGPSKFRSGPSGKFRSGPAGESRGPGGGGGKFRSGPSKFRGGGGDQRPGSRRDEGGGGFRSEGPRGGDQRPGFRRDEGGGGFRSEGPRGDKRPGFRRDEGGGGRHPRSTRGEAPTREPGGEPEPRSASSRFVFGVNPALEALRARPEEIDRLFFAEGSMNPSVSGELLARAREAGVRIDEVPRERLSAFADGGVHQGVVVEMREFKYSELDELLTDPGLVVVLDSLQDPQNVGAIIRSANAFGAKGVVIAKDRAAAITGAVVKASAGATEHTKIVRVVNLSRALEELKTAGYWTVAADPEGDALGTKKLDGPLAVVIGAEGPGVRQGVLSHCDFKVKIPMLGKVESLNASVSAGILLYEIVRQRTAK